MRYLLFLLTLTFFYSPLCAQEPDTTLLNELFDLSLEELQQVRVTVASKYQEDLSETPSSVTVFTAAEIEALGVQNVYELLNFVPGFQATSAVRSGNSHTLFVRGRESPLTISEGVLVLLDGQRLNDVYTGGVVNVNRLLSLTNLKQVEVIRGPGSALYGSNAFLGVINLVTDDSRNEIQLGVGDIGQHQMNAAVSQMLGGFKVSAQMQAFSDKGYQFEDVTDANGQTANTRDPALGYDFNLQVKKGAFTLRGRHMERRLTDFMTFGTLAEQINREQFSQSHFKLDYTPKLKNNWQLTASAGYVRETLDQFALLIPAGVEIAPGFALDEAFYGGPIIRSAHGQANVDAQKRFGERFKLSFGASYMQEVLLETANQMTHNPISLEYQGGSITFFEDEATNFNEPKLPRDIIGLYASTRTELWPRRLELVLGTRYDYYSDFGSTFNPRAALIAKLPEQFRLKVMYGEAFRAPNYLELYDRNNPVDFGNAALQPEKIRTTEVALVRHMKKMKFSVTYFHSQIEQRIALGEAVEAPGNPLGAPQFFNEDGNFTSDGLEIEWSATLLERLNIRLAATQLLGETNPLIPETFLSYALTYKQDKLSLNLNGIFRTALNALPEQETYTFLNLRAGYRFSERFRAYATVRNVLDNNFLTYSAVLPTGVPNRGRTFMLSGALRF